MTVTQAGSDAKFYLVFFQFPDFSESKKIIVNARGSSHMEAFTYPQDTGGAYVGRETSKGQPLGLKGLHTIRFRADVVVMLQRSGKPDNIYKDREMPALEESKLFELLGRMGLC